MSGSNGDEPRGLLGRLRQRLPEDRRNVSLGNGARVIDENNPEAGMFGMPANPAPEQGFVAVPQGDILNLPSIQGALRELANREQRQGQISNLNRTRSDILAIAGPAYQPEPNVLDEFANYTYHIKLSMTNDIDAYAIETGEDLTQSSKVIIAESGVTAGFNISDFEIENNCAPGPRVRAMMHTKWRMTIREPYGLSLVDRIFEISKQMGVINHLTAPYFIEVWFTGYNEDGSIATADMSKLIYRFFRVNITKIMSDTTSSGTVYQIEGLFDGMYANSDHVAVAPNGITVNGATTVGDFFRKLAIELNKQQSDLQYDSLRRIEYEFIMSNDMAQWPLIQNNSASQRNADISVRYRGNVPSISIARGMDISTILYFVIGMTQKGRDFVAGETQRPRGTNAPTMTGARSGSGPSTASLRANGLANMLAIHSQTRLVGYDYLINDYVRKVTFTFTEYPTTRAIVDVATARNALRNGQEDRMNSLLSSNRYVKAYEYIYSGRNLDILRLDIKLELTWQASIPLQLGENNYQNFTVGAQQDQNSVAVDILSRYNQAQARRADLSARVEELNRTQNRTREQNQNLNELRRDLRQTEEEIRQLSLDRSGFQVLWGNRGPGGRAVDNLRALQNLRTGNVSIFQNERVANDLAARIRWASMRQQRYLEDVQVLPIAADQRIPVSFRPNPGPSLSVVGGESAQDRASAQRSPGDPPRGRGLVATVLNDVMAAPYLLTIDLEIRGDPFWLGLGNVEENRVLGSSANPPSQEILREAGAAWFYHGETGFLLTFQTGEAPDEQTGFMRFDQSTVAYAGLYSALEIKSTFSNGKFTQMIRAVRDNLLDLPGLSANRATQASVSPAASAIPVAQQAPLQQPPAQSRPAPQQRPPATPQAPIPPYSPGVVPNATPVSAPTPAGVIDQTLDLINNNPGGPGTSPFG